MSPLVADAAIRPSFHPDARAPVLGPRRSRREQIGIFGCLGWVAAAGILSGVRRLSGAAEWPPGTSAGGMGPGAGPKRPR
jgi:hypothetical protein